MSLIVEESSGVTVCKILDGCTIREYEAVLIDFIQMGFPHKFMVSIVAEHTTWTLKELKKHFELIQKYKSKFTPRHKLAIVSKKPGTFAKGRMSQGQLAAVVPCRIEVFRSEEEAMKWLCDEEKN